MSKEPFAPDFFIVGAPKCGTTFLASALDQHPGIGISRPKEPKFFSTYWNLGWEWYRQCFSHVPHDALLGDASTQYSILGVYPKAIQRISQHAPRAKIIYIARNPIDRIRSQYIENARAWRTPRAFVDEIASDPEYVDATLYWKQLSAYLEKYRPDHVLPLVFDDLIRSPHDTLRRCVEHLGVGTFSFDLDACVQNESAGKRQPRPWARLLVSAVPPIRRLASRLPASMLRVVVRLAKSKIDKPAVNDEVRNWILDRVAEDAQMYLQYCGRRRDLWFSAT